MSGTCPCCGGTGLAEPEPDSLALLRRWCEERGHRVDPLDRVDERAAADVLGLVPGTLRNDRAYFNRLRYCRVGRRVMYELRTLAAHLESEA